MGFPAYALPEGPGFIPGHPRVDPHLGPQSDGAGFCLASARYARPARLPFGSEVWAYVFPKFLSFPIPGIVRIPEV